ncbi:hypothetical protein HLRTI_000987 [Halorhabdus tiamatea SARL4B]|uniref:Uncharacterized protein n=1 Tax=Halorhabdus tiamatea SARL4B TaxID=1033806 RepID=U2FF49_9EURY|nr:hypothetical protein HLRTI_000987 [Halorhabdus tiamatea SARL4B]
MRLQGGDSTDLTRYWETPTSEQSDMFFQT